MNEFNLNFMHPQYGTMFNVTIDGAFTVAEMLNNLVLSGFIAANESGYQLALYDQILTPDQTFDSIEQLQDNDVLRIIRQEQTTTSTAESPIVTVCVQPPHLLAAVPIKITLEATGNALLEALQQKGFLLGDVALWQLKKGELSLDLSSTLAELGVVAGDGLTIAPANAENANQTIVQQLLANQQTTQEQLQLLQQQLEQIQTKLAEKDSDAPIVNNEQWTKAPYQSLGQLIRKILN